MPTRHTASVRVRSGKRLRGKPRHFVSARQRNAVMAQYQAMQPRIRAEARRAVRRYHLPEAQGDFESAGAEAVLQFSKRYRPGQAQFQTGATQAIRASLAREAAQHRTVRVPEKALKRVTQAERLPQRVSLSAAVDLPDRSGGIEQVEHRRHLSQLMSSLSPQQRKVVLLSSQGYNHTAIAKQLRMSPQRARTMYTRSITKMRALDRD